MYLQSSEKSVDKKGEQSSGEHEKKKENAEKSENFSRDSRERARHKTHEINSRLRSWRSSR